MSHPGELRNWKRKKREKKKTLKPCGTRELHKFWFSYFENERKMKGMGKKRYAKKKKKKTR